MSGFSEYTAFVTPVHRLNSREGWCAWSVCWVGCFVSFLFLSLNLMVQPCLVLVFLFFPKHQTRVDCKRREAGGFASWLVRTDWQWVRCLHRHPPRQEPLCCPPLAGLPLLPQPASEGLQPELPPVNMCLKKQKLREIRHFAEKRRDWASADGLQWQRQELRHRSLRDVLLHQWSFLFVCFGHILGYFFLLIMYNLSWQKKQEREWQGEQYHTNGFSCEHR